MMKEIGFRAISYWDYVEERLFFWLRYYDNAYQLLQYEEYLDTLVIDDDMRLDAFFIYYSWQKDKEKEERIKEEKNRDKENKHGSSKGMVSLDDMNISKMVGGFNDSK